MKKSQVLLLKSSILQGAISLVIVRRRSHRKVLRSILTVKKAGNQNPIIDRMRMKRMICKSYRVSNGGLSSNEVFFIMKFLMILVFFITFWIYYFEIIESKVFSK